MTQAGDRRVVVIGAGGHAKVAIEALRFSGWNVIGCTDRDTTERLVVGTPVLGDDGILPSVRSSGVRFAFPALGSNALRARIAAELAALGFDLPNAVAPAVTISESARIGRGVALFAGASVNADAEIADFAIINTNASVDHDCRIGMAAHIAPGCALAGGVEVGARSFVGIGSAVIPGVRIGEDCMIGAGSAVVSDIRSGSTAFGVPARIRPA